MQVVFRRRESDPALAREVEDLRQRDMVTGLLNRSTFLHALEDAVSKVARGEDPVSYTHLDVYKRQRLSGYLVPRLVREVPGDPGKRPL